MKVVLSRAQLPNGVDTTVKSSHGWARAFAPTWDMVMGHKRGEVSDGDYTALYLKILEQALQSGAVRELYNAGLAGGGKLTVACYCRDGWFCHTHILIDWLVNKWPDHFGDGR